MKHVYATRNTETSRQDNWRQLFYQQYESFKGWSDPDKAPDEGFALEMRRAGLARGHCVLELGFGAGAFLDWCRQFGCRVTGIEAIDSLAAAARCRGHNVRAGDVVTELSKLEGPFDLVASFDLFEHLTVPQLLDLFASIQRVLSPNGKIVARFPNGASPFSAPYQYGDVTHTTVLSPQRIDQIARRSGMRLATALNSARPSRGRRMPWALRLLAYLVRNLIEIALGLIYYHGDRIPMDPNCTVIVIRDTEGVAPDSPRPSSQAAQRKV